MIPLLTILAILVGLSSVLVTIWKLKEAPLAFEDDAGFHLEHREPETLPGQVGPPELAPVTSRAAGPLSPASFLP